MLSGLSDILNGPDGAVGSAKKRYTAINVADLSPADDPFTQLLDDEVDWISYSGLPSNLIERKVQRIKISRYRAAFQASRAVRPGHFVISHLPLMTAAVATSMSLLAKDAPHLAFSFNFTDLPTGRRLGYFRKALSKVDRFAVYSHFEVKRYSEHFDLAPGLLQPVIWTQEMPAVQSDPALPLGRSYVCALGGEGRDFDLLIEAARRLGPTMPMVVIARPHSLQGVALPDHVQLLTNIPAERAWRIAVDSLGVLIPLKSPETCCGHITLVSAKMLGLPVATTFAHATREYVEGREAVLQCNSNDVAAFAGLIERLFDEQSELARKAKLAATVEQKFHDRSHWADYLRSFIRQSAF